MIEFGNYRYDSESRSLYRDGEKISVSAEVLAVLESLLEKPGEAVSEEALLTLAGKGNIAADASLTETITQLRVLLSDDDGEPTYIEETSERRYRLITKPPVAPDGDRTDLSTRVRTRADSAVGSDGEDHPPAPGTALLGRGSRLGDYEIVAPLGAGAMGEVWRALDTTLDREVAIKVIPEELAADPELMQRFSREARLLAAIDHPNIVTAYSVEENDGFHFITMQLVDGRTLDDSIPDDGMPLGELLELAIPLVGAIGAAHQRGITHRDLKPANIMVSDDGWLRVLDFGIAKPGDGPMAADKAGTAGERVGVADDASQNLTQAGTVMGTLTYMSPEQALGKPADARSDLFSLGVTLYEMATGMRPFTGSTSTEVIDAILTVTPVAPEELNDRVPRELGRAIGRLLEKDPDARFQSAGELAEVLEEMRREQSATRKWAIPVAIAAAALLAFAVYAVWQASNVRWARQEALPEIERLAAAGDLLAAYEHAVDAERYLADDPALIDLWSIVSRRITVETDPVGVDVYFKPYADPDAEWELLGTTPVEAARIPRVYFRWRLTKEGYGPVEAARHVLAEQQDAPLRRTLLPEHDAPAGMVRVHGSASWAPYDGLPALARNVDLEPYWIDKYEVTNQQYKVFVDAGGYEAEQYWKQPFVDDGAALSWRQAMHRFRDATGAPGPATWKLGDYPDGEDDYPVAGVSWYEAAAYAEFAGKELPTVRHFGWAAGPGLGGHIIPVSNLEGTGITAVGTHQGMSPVGAYDMAGNLKEWTWNAMGDQRAVVGGAWDEVMYSANAALGARPMARDANVGFRTMTRLSDAPLPDGVADPIDDPVAGLIVPPPVSDEVFESFLSQFDYDRRPLDARDEWTDDTAEHWVGRKVSFDAAYGDERLGAYLYLPRNVVPPYQTVIYFPGSYPTELSSSEGLMTGPNGVAQGAPLDFLPRTGRALMYPIYKGTFEREIDLNGNVDPDDSVRYRSLLTMWYQDFARSIDYLEESEEFGDRVAMYGYSWGSVLANIFATLEARLDVTIQLSGCQWWGYELPLNVDPLVYMPRVRLPSLLIYGRYDYWCPYENVTLPWHERLGTPEEDKPLKTSLSAHRVPRHFVMRETLPFLDKYLGTVQ